MLVSVAAQNANSSFFNICLRHAVNVGSSMVPFCQPTLHIETCLPMDWLCEALLYYYYYYNNYYYYMYIVGVAAAAVDVAKCVCVMKMTEAVDSRREPQ